MAGYSQTPLIKKLGIKSGHRLCVLDAPAEFSRTLGPLPQGCTNAHALGIGESFDVVLCFTTSRADLEAALPELRARIFPSGAIWIAWPKRASGVVSDLTEDVVRELALQTRLVDNKVCAIDETWSGLRLVVRLVDRPGTRKQ